MTTHTSREERYHNTLQYVVDKLQEILDNNPNSEKEWQGVIQELLWAVTLQIRKWDRGEDWLN